MHVALIIDDERLLRERAMLGRVTAGLTERGVQLVVVIPEDAAAGDDAGEAVVATATFGTRMRVPAWMRRPRARRLADALGSAVPDLVYAVGESAWAVGLDLAKLLDRPALVDLWTADQTRRIPPGRSAARIAGYVVPTEPLAEAARQRVEAELVSLVPMGVEVPPEPRDVLVDPDASLTLAIIGGGEDPAGHRAMLTGLGRLTKQFPQIQACLELRGRDDHEIWRYARRLDLLGHISAIGDAALHRPLLTGCDVFVMPQRSGQVRSLLLQAMGLGMPVVAAEDPCLDMLVEDETALIVSRPDADEWTEALRRVLTDADLVRRLCRTARAWVSQHHRPQDQVARLAGAFEQIVSGGAHSFPAEMK